MSLKHQYINYAQLKAESFREILEDSDVIQLNQMLVEGVSLERVIKHFFQVKMDDKSQLKVSTLSERHAEEVVLGGNAKVDGWR